jgi:hypothetical protein
MSRTEREALRKCPTCATPATEAALGLRDYRWVNAAFPGNVGGMDIDFMVDQHKTGRMLAMEFKPAGAYITTGARLTFASLRKKGVDVWAAWDHGDHVRWSELDSYGEPLKHVAGSRDDLRRSVRGWWDEG